MEGHKSRPTSEWCCWRSWMATICSSPSLSSASKVASGIILLLCIFCQANATTAGLDAGPEVVPPPSLELPTVPEGWIQVNLTIDSPRGTRFKPVVIRNDADGAEVSEVITEACREVGGTHEQASMLLAQWRLYQLQLGQKGYVLNPRTKNTFQRFLGREIVLTGEQPFNMLETGSSEGASASWIAEHLLKHQASLLVCLDTWGGARGTDNNAADVEERFHFNMAKAPNGERVVAFKGDPLNSLADLLAKGLYASFDAVYVDASHEMKDVLGEALLSFRLLKVGGVMIFDDNWMRGVARAMTAFEEAVGELLQVLHRDENHLVVTKVAEDRFTTYDSELVLGEHSRLEHLQ